MAKKNYYGKLDIILIILLTSYPSYNRADEIGEIISGVWSKLWSMSCDYSTMVLRSRRSLEFPDTNNPDEFFQYLYPSLNLNAEDMLVDGARSLSLHSWMDDLGEYWEIECSKAKRKTMKRNITRAKSKVRNSTRSSYSSTLKNVTQAEDGSVDGGIYPNNTEYLNKTSRQSTFFGVPLPGPTFPDIASALGLPSIATPTISPLALKQQNKFFASFGGDIEYFFPLIGFGIPFDGEITLLGFHGFKGIFPYKKR